MSLYNCPNCNFPKISLYSNPSMDLPHNPTLCQRVNNARDISQNMTSAGKTDWSQINVGGPYLPSFAQSQQYALGVAKGLATNTNQVPQNTLITPNNTIPTSGAYTQYAYEIAKGAQQTANNQVGGSRKRFSKKNKSKKNKKKNKIGGVIQEGPQKIPIELRLPPVGTGFGDVITTQDKVISSFWENGNASFSKNGNYLTFDFSNSKVNDLSISFDKYALNSCVRSSSNTLMPNRLARNNRIDLYFQKQLVASLDIKNKYDQVESWIKNNSTEHAKCNTKNGGQKKYQKRSSKKNKKTNRSKKNKNKIGGMAKELPADPGYIIYKPDGNKSQMKKQQMIFGKDEKGKYIRLPGWVVGDYKRYIKSLTRHSQRGIPESYKGNPVPALVIVTKDEYIYTFVPDDRNVEGILDFLDTEGGGKKSKKRFSKRVNKRNRSKKNKI